MAERRPGRHPVGGGLHGDQRQVEVVDRAGHKAALGLQVEPDGALQLVVIVLLVAEGHRGSGGYRLTLQDVMVGHQQPRRDQESGTALAVGPLTRATASAAARACWIQRPGRKSRLPTTFSSARSSCSAVRSWVMSRPCRLAYARLRMTVSVRHA